MNLILLQAEKWLNELGITTVQTTTNTLAVNRQEMILVAGDAQQILTELKTVVGPRIFWDSEGTYNNMDCMFLGAF